MTRVHGGKMNNIRSKTPTYNRHELFRTPEYGYAKLFDAHPNWFTGRVLDPSAGDGRMVEELVRRGNGNLHCLIDIRKSELKTWRRSRILRNQTLLIGDFTRLRTREIYDASLTNPPFTKSCAFVEQMLSSVKPGGIVSILQSVQWLGTQRRSHWLASMPFYRLDVLAKRPTWELDDHVFIGTNHYDYAWFSFKKGYTGEGTVGWLL